MEIERVVVPCIQCHVKHVVWMQRVLVRWIEKVAARPVVAGRKNKAVNYTCIDCSKFAPIGTRQQFDAAAQALLQEGD